MHCHRFIFVPVILLALLCSAAASDGGKLQFERDPRAAFKFEGFVGGRIAAGVTNWLQPAPHANPGMLEMFALRDRQPPPNLVPWAGEFVGKYLISAIQTERLGHPELRPVIQSTIAALIASQADDGYLGPFPRHERLLKHWDLWGHYHCILALLLWHEQTGDSQALQCAQRAADLACKIYLSGSRRMIDADSDEMNLSIIHALGWLHRLTKEQRYLAMMREIEKDWERGGDFVNAALQGKEFFETPRPRWESLHSIQGLIELWRITGDAKYKRAFEHLWRSIARWDLRNTGGFSSGEQATGNPYSPTAIETCCTIAWMALSTDMLQLTGEPRAADLLELATFNGWAGAQHPSGRWCTYSTPMDGAREASAHAIVFQSRPGTPELNCCSVNGPRGWSMLTDWAVLRATNGVVLNWLAPGTFTTHAPDGSDVRLDVTGDYPLQGRVQVRVRSSSTAPFALHLRIPRWAAEVTAVVSGEKISEARPGSHLLLHRIWSDHQIALTFRMPLRVEVGAREAAAKGSIYRGPLLFAWDQRFNDYNADQLPALDPATLGDVPLSSVSTSPFPPLASVNLAAAGQKITLVDFASAGATGTRYLTWLPLTNAPPAPVVTRLPRDGATLPPGQLLFRWTAAEPGARYTLEISDTEDYVLLTNATTDRAALLALPFDKPGLRYWRVTTQNEHGRTIAQSPPARFQFDPALPAVHQSLPPPPVLGPNGELVGENFAMGNSDGRSFNGRDEKARYELPEWPEESVSITLRFRLDAFPEGRIAQLFSAWSGPMDDPLRLTIDQGRLFARVEAGANYSTPGFPIEKGRWYSVAAVQTAGKLTLWIDGVERGSTTTPMFLSTRAKNFALCGNPNYTGNEHLAATIAEFSFYSRALTAPEIAASAKHPDSKTN